MHGRAVDLRGVHREGAHDVLVAHALADFRLAPEALELAFVRHQLRVEDLDGDARAGGARRAVPGRLRLVDGAHAAASQLAVELVLAQGSSRQIDSHTRAGL